MATVTRPPRPPGLSLFKIYRDHITLGAIHGYCDEEFVSFGPIEGRTEHAVQRRILDWISRQRSRGSHRKKEIAFLTGSTDSRRSAVACSVAEACQKIGSLAATFIPPAESDAYSAKQFLMATLAYQMSMLDGLENFSGYVVEAIDRDIHIFTRPLRDQLDSVLLEPLRLISENEPPPLRYDPKPTSPIIVVIDNLERISLTDAAQGGDGYETLDVLLSAAGSSTFPFLILVTSGAPDWTYSFVTNRGIGFKEFSLGVGGAQGARGAGASAGMLGIHGIRREVFLGLPNVPHVPVEAQACYTQSREDTKCSCGRLHCALEKKLLFTADILGVSMAIATFFLKILQRTVLSDAPSTGLRELCSGLLTIVASIEDKAVVKDEVIGIIVDYLRVTCIVCEHFRRQNNRIAPWVHLAIDKLHCEVTQYRREMSEGVLDATRSGVDSVGVLDGADVWRSRLAASWATISAELLEDAGQKLTEADVGRIETAKRMVEEMVAKQGSKINHDTFPFDPSDDYPATSYHYGNYKSGSRMVSALTTMSDRQAVSGTARPYPPNSDR